MFGHLLSAEDQEKFVTASFVKLMMEEKNKLIKQKQLIHATGDFVYEY